jgi:hypothetical protein
MHAFINFLKERIIVIKQKLQSSRKLLRISMMNVTVVSNRYYFHYLLTNQFLFFYFLITFIHYLHQIIFKKFQSICVILNNYRKKVELIISEKIDYYSKTEYYVFYTNSMLTKQNISFIHLIRDKIICFIIDIMTY